MSFRNAGPIAAAVVFGIIGGTVFCFSNTWFGHNADAKVYAGSYTFGPLLKEQQKANDHWRNPGYV